MPRDLGSGKKVARILYCKVGPHSLLNMDLRILHRGGQKGINSSIHQLMHVEWWPFHSMIAAM